VLATAAVLGHGNLGTQLRPAVACRREEFSLADASRADLGDHCAAPEPFHGHLPANAGLASGEARTL
jgi:hypothetical protein